MAASLTFSLIGLEGLQKESDLLLTIRSEPIKDQMNVNFFLYLVNNVPCPQFNVWEENFFRFRISLTKFTNRAYSVVDK